MSITFFSPEAPRKIVDTFECRCFAEGEEPSPSCPHCQGTGKVHFHGTENEVNVSNMHGFELLQYLGLEPDYSGKVEGDALYRVLRTIMVALNSGIEDDARESQEEYIPCRVETDADGNKKLTSGATIIQAGRPAGYVTERLKQFQTLFKEAADNGWTVCWG